MPTATSARTWILQARPPVAALYPVKLRVGDVEPCAMDFGRLLELGEEANSTPAAPSITFTPSGPTASEIEISEDGKIVSFVVTAGDVAGMYRVKVAAGTSYDNDRVGDGMLFVGE